MSYYALHGKEYIESTLDTNMNEVYMFFEPYIKEGGSILDVGFGSGRDMLHFKRMGYEVSGIDQEQVFVEHGLALGLDVSIGDLLTYESNKRYDGIWANASLVHLSLEDFYKAIHHLLSLLNDDGVLFVSMKLGSSFEIDELGRPMLYVDESAFSEFNLVESKRTLDATRPITWVNVILKK